MLAKYLISLIILLNIITISSCAFADALPDNIKDISPKIIKNSGASVNKDLKNGLTEKPELIKDNSVGAAASIDESQGCIVEKKENKFISFFKKYVSFPKIRDRVFSFLKIIAIAILIFLLLRLLAKLVSTLLNKNSSNTPVGLSSVNTQKKTGEHEMISQAVSSFIRHRLKK